MSFYSDKDTALDVYKSTNEHTIPPPGYAGSGEKNREPTTVWGRYIDKATHHDKDLVEDANNTVETLLIFAGLFSAVVSAFIAITYPMLKPDPGDILAEILLELQGQGSSTSSAEFEPPNYAIRVNCFLFVGLFISIMVSLLSILVKQWTRSYQRDLAGVSSQHLRARIRHFRYHGAEKWHLTGVVGLLSISMHVALFVSAIGIIDLLLATTRIVGIVALSVFLLGATFFFGTTLIPIFYLDAPFRSPLSELFSDIKGWIHRPDYLRRKKGTDEEGLDDHMEESRGGLQPSDADSIVRTQLHLDLDILSELMSEADKSTERWMLDLCFEKLPGLNVLARQNPSLILNRNILIDAYIFLSEGSTIFNKRGEKEVHPTRIDRARQLCKFLAWFLTLRRTTEERQRLCVMLKNGKNDPYTLPRALANDSGVDLSTVPATAALGRLNHLFDIPMDQTTCPLCFKEASTLQGQLPTQPARNETLVQDVTNFIITRTDCLLFWNWAEDSNWKTDQNLQRDANAKSHLALLQEATVLCVPSKKEKDLWKGELNARKKVAAKALVDFWFDPLLDTIDTIPVSRAPTPGIFAPRATPTGVGGAGGNSSGGGRSNGVFSIAAPSPRLFNLPNRNSLSPTSAFNFAQLSSPNQPAHPHISASSIATSNTAATPTTRTPAISISTPTAPPST